MKVVTPDDEVGNAVIFAADGVKNRLTRPRVAHRGGEAVEQGALLGEVVLQQHLVGLDAHRRGDVVALGRADQRVQHQAVANLQRALHQVFVGAVDGVAGLEGDDAPPALLGEIGAGLGGCQVDIWELGLGGGQHIDLTGQVHLAPRIDAGDARVVAVVGAIDLARLVLAVVGEFFAQFQQPDDGAIGHCGRWRCP